MKYPNVKEEFVQHFAIALTDEQIEKYVKTHRVLKEDLPEDILDTMTRDLLIDAIVVDVLGEDWHWPLNMDGEEYTKRFVQAFFLEAERKGFILEDRK